MARLKDKYIQEVIPAMQKTRGYRNVMQVPRMVKIVVNMGINSTVEKDVIKTLVRDLATITGQMPVLCLARKSIANFKLREGMPAGDQKDLDWGTLLFHAINIDRSVYSTNEQWKYTITKDGLSAEEDLP